MKKLLLLLPVVALTACGMDYDDHESHDYSDAQEMSQDMPMVIQAGEGVTVEVSTDSMADKADTQDTPVTEASPAVETSPLEADASSDDIIADVEAIESELLEGLDF